MKLSIFTTITDPVQRGDNPTSALNCYSKLADELVVVNGGNTEDVDKLKINWSTMLWDRWPKEFEWPLIGQQFQRGYHACSGDWVIHADLDFLFHERDFVAIREVMEKHKHAPALSFWKYQFILPDRYNLKSRLVLAVNKGKYGDRIRFDSGGDLAQPSLDGKYLSPNDVPESRVPFYNYEKMTKTKEQIMEDQGRMDRAYFRHFGRYQLSKDGSDESAYEGWLKMVTGRFSKPQKAIKLEEHSKYIQDTIKNLKPSQWGYSGFGTLGENKYVQSYSSSR